MTMDFSLADDLAEHREAARAWVEANMVPEWLEEQHRTGTHETPELRSLMARDGILGAGWARQYGGSDVDPGFAAAVRDAIASTGILLHGWATTAMVLHTI